MNVCQYLEFVILSFVNVLEDLLHQAVDFGWRSKYLIRIRIDECHIASVVAWTSAWASAIRHL
jgi:hypothetical protein